MPQVRVVILKLNLKGSIEVELIEILDICLDTGEQRKLRRERHYNYNSKASCLGDSVDDIR